MELADINMVIIIFLCLYNDLFDFLIIKKINYNKNYKLENLSYIKMSSNGRKSNHLDRLK
jgi:hypothetical protein